MKNEKEQIAKAGKLLKVDHGEYSDYGVIGFFLVLKDFNPMKELKEYLLVNKTTYGAGYSSFSYDSFLMLLISKGYLLEIEYGNLYMGRYTDSDQVRFTPSI